MGFANKTDMVDICLVNTVNQKTVASVMESDSDQSMGVALVADVAIRVAMGHYVVEVLLAAVAAVVSIVTLEFVDTFCSVD